MGMGLCTDAGSEAGLDDCCEMAVAWEARCKVQCSSGGQDVSGQRQYTFSLGRMGWAGLGWAVHTGAVCRVHQQL